MRNVLTAILLALSIGPATVSANSSLPIALSIQPQETDPASIDLSQLKPGDDVAVSPSEIDPYLEKLAMTIAAFQEAFRSQYGIYAQTLSPYLEPPMDGKAELPSLDTQNKAPTSGVTADTLFVLANMEAFPASVRIDVYSGPTGAGYVVVAETEFSGVLWQRAINVGPEKWREQSWLDTKPGAP